jgi:DNA-binding MarR family transcriptional regulator
MEADLSAIRRSMRSLLESEVARGKLTVPQTAVMRVVVRQHGINLKVLSREVSLAHSTVNRLEQLGMLERRADTQDGRNTRIYPTAPVAEFVRERIPQLSRGPLQAALARATGREGAFGDQQGGTPAERTAGREVRIAKTHERHSVFSQRFPIRVLCNELRASSGSCRKCLW